MVIGIIVIIFLFCIGVIKNRVDNYKENVISFKDNLIISGMPVVDVLCNKEDICLLIDTGSDKSYISPTAVNIFKKYIESEETVKTKIICGGSSEVSETRVVELPVEFNKFNTRMISFITMPSLDRQFREIEQTRNITIHGIIGSDFLEQNKTELDFNKLCMHFK